MQVGYVRKGIKKESLISDVIYLSGSKNDETAEIALLWSTAYDTKVMSFANTIHTIDGGTPVENVNVETLEIALTKGNHMIEIVSHQQSGDCYMSAPKLVELPPSYTVTYMPGEGTGAWIVDDEAIIHKTLSGEVVSVYNL